MVSSRKLISINYFINGSLHLCFQGNSTLATFLLIDHMYAASMLQILKHKTHKALYSVNSFILIDHFRLCIQEIRVVLRIKMQGINELLPLQTKSHSRSHEWDVAQGRSWKLHKSNSFVTSLHHFLCHSNTQSFTDMKDKMPKKKISHIKIHGETKFYISLTFQWILYARKQWIASKTFVPLTIPSSKCKLKANKIDRPKKSKMSYLTWPT